MLDLYFFGKQRPAITKHLKNIFESGELKEELVSSILEHTTQHGAIEGKTQETKVKFYNLDAILSVGYRVNSKRGTQFPYGQVEYSGQTVPLIPEQTMPVIPEQTMPPEQSRDD